jgi:hypothetical protein
MMVTSSDTIEGYIATILSAMNMFLYFVVIRNAYFKTGEEAMRDKHCNDIERRDMLATHRYRELDKVKEYNPKKILIFLAPIIVPFVVLMVIAFIIAVCGGDTTGIYAVIRIAYAMIFSFFMGISKTASIHFTWLGIVILIAPVVVGYMSGVNRVRNEYATAEKVKEMVDGEKK